MEVGVDNNIKKDDTSDNSNDNNKTTDPNVNVTHNKIYQEIVSGNAADCKTTEQNELTKIKIKQALETNKIKNTVAKLINNLTNLEISNVDLVNNNNNNKTNEFNMLLNFQTNLNNIVELLNCLFENLKQLNMAHLKNKQYNESMYNQLKSKNKLINILKLRLEESELLATNGENYKNKLNQLHKLNE